jgi:hypothetical protein
MRFVELFGLLGGLWGNVDDEGVRNAQAMEVISFSRLSWPLDDVMDIDIWSNSMLGSVRGIPMLNSEAFNLLMLPWIHTIVNQSALRYRRMSFPVPVIQLR